MTTSALRRIATSSLVLASLSTGLTAIAHADTLPDATTASVASAGAAPLAAQTANGMPSTGDHALGFTQDAASVRRTPLSAFALNPASLPASVDLSQFAPAVGNQGGVNSCAAWSTGYYLRGWYAKRDGYFPSGGNPTTGSFAPMYTYAQIVKGQNIGTSFSDNLNIQQNQGIDSRADYTQGDYNYTSQPSSAETANAGIVKIDSYQIVEGPGGFLGGPLQNYIETKLAGGDPIVISIPVYPEFDNVSAAQPLVKSPTAGETSRGLHAVTAFKYDSAGVWIENQWGTSFGLNGWAELSWDFVNRYSVEAASIAPLSPLERFYNGSTMTHWVTRNANAVSSGYQYERTLGRLYPAPQSGTVPLYGCLVAGSNDHFVSLSSTCEGRVRLGVDGYLFSGWQLFVPTVQIYRCYRVVNGHGDHWVSTDPHCEGYTTDFSLGYLRA